ncbi:hypothetical protein K0U83_26695 [bacterium]|nr:hypothetical protein [bacterium]
MAYTGSERDYQTALLASQTILQAEEMGLIVDGDLTSLANAKAAVQTASDADQITTQIYADQVKRALDLAVAFGGAAVATSSSLATLYAALPDNGGNTARMRM